MISSSGFSSSRTIKRFPIFRKGFPEQTGISSDEDIGHTGIIKKNKRKYPKVKVGGVGEFRGLNSLQKEEIPKSKIRLGYVSGDFRNHAVAQLMLRLFELHDRQGFEVFVYSLDPDEGFLPR